MTKLGPHGQKPSAAVDRWARVAPVVKLMDNADSFALAPDHAYRIFRAYTGDGATDVEWVYRTIIERLKGYRHPNLWCEIINEPSQWDASVIDFAEAIVPKLHAAGLKVIGPCWSTGTPQEENWIKWRARGWAGLDGVAVHGYWGPEGPTTWHALRFARFWKEGDPPVFITECGRDDIEGGERWRGGWIADGLSPEQYVAELLAFDAELVKYEYVLGATPFTGGPDYKWTTFDTDPITDLLIASTPPQPPSGGSSDQPRFAPEGAFVAAYQPAVWGVATGPVHYPEVDEGPSESRPASQHYSRGLAYWTGSSVRWVARGT